MEILLSKRNGWHRIRNWRRCPPIRKFFHIGFVFGPFLVLTCPHKNLRCIHGRERQETMRTVFGDYSGRVAEVRCIDCGQPLHGRPRLRKCSVTGFRHF